ncbi:hypothetical protein [Bacillus sp. V2I10]|uniref:hypothetical protein n=1 Tax=Bacillus sp. V2I10 TaxID=3042276 RepID=UPI002788FD54|nr:hypothetical protein [Bacillus sp. V2I10]MDQ0862326.1 hypothetical protein [Bacillus sp. V2I10]
MECRKCDKYIRVRDIAQHKKRNGLCKSCHEKETKWIQQGLKFAIPPKKKAK